MKYFLSFMIPVLTSFQFARAQSHPVALRNDISLSRILTVKNGAIRLSKDPVSQSFFYIAGTGNIYKIIRGPGGLAHDTLVYSAGETGIDYPESLAFKDSILYLLGNNSSGQDFTIGILRKGILKSNGKREWHTVMITDHHPLSGPFDHKFSGMVLSPAGDSITINSGARGDHGEVETLNGLFPGVRNVPLTGKLFRIASKDSTFLYNDSLWLSSSGYLFAEGTRNNFSMAYDAKGNLFGLENSGDRDHNDEMNWLQKGHHYGFPFFMGDTRNPQQYANYNPNTDKLINHYSEAWRKGTFYNDPAFPSQRAGVQFDKPIQNIGPDCDKFRDTITATVRDASDLGITLGSFSAHRSPLGLVFDNDSACGSDLRGDAFMLSWTKGLDSTGGIETKYDTTIGPFVDPSQDLTHLHLIYDAAANSYKMSATRIVAEFSNPVDAKIDGNKIYVLENGYNSKAGLYEVQMPVHVTAIPEYAIATGFICYPNPSANTVTFRCNGSSEKQFNLRIYDTQGKELVQFRNIINAQMQQTISTDGLPAGIYFYELTATDCRYYGKFTMVK